MKNKMFGRIMALFLAALMVFGVVAMLAGCKKTDPYANLSDAEYIQKVEKENLEDAIAGLADVYGALGKLDSGTNILANSNMDVNIQIGDMIVDLLEEKYKQATGKEIDFSSLANIGMNTEVSMDGDLMKENVTLLLNNKKILSAVVLMNMAESVTYFAVPELNEVFMKVDMNAMMGGAGVANSPADIMGMLPQMMEKLPSEEVFEKLLNRYVDVILANLKNVTRTTETLEAGGLSQTCTKVSVKIYELDAIDMVTDVLNTALTDQDLKTVIDGISEIADEDLYPAFKQAVEQALATVKELSEEPDTENYIELITYTDANHEIIGRELFWPEQEDAVATYYTVTSGDKFVFNAAVQGVVLTGSGTEKKGAITGTYTLSVGGTDYVTMEVANFKATDKELTGTIRVEPTAKLLNMIFGSTSGLPFADFALEIQLATDGLTIKLLGNDELIVSFGMKMKEATGGKIEEPSNVVDVTNSSALQSWMNGMDMDTVLANLEAAGVPSELVDTLMQLMGF